MGFSKAAAAIAQGIAPRVQDTYSNAANADAGYARGLGDNVQADINQRAAAANDFLTKMGTPTAGLEKPADVGGTAYGLEGYIPATTLQREGAAFGSAAEMLPGDILSQGQRSASAALNDNTNIAKLHSELARIAATQPALYQQLLSQYQGQADRQAEIGLSAGRLNLARQSLASENQYRNSARASSASTSRRSRVRPSRRTTRTATTSSHRQHRRRPEVASAQGCPGRRSEEARAARRLHARRACPHQGRGWNIA
jgi:hypothetical protein